VAGDDRRILKQGTEIRRGVALTRMRTELLQVGREHPVRAEEGLDAHRCGHVGESQEPVEVVAGEDEHPEHAVGAVEEGEAFLLGQLDRRKPLRGQGFC
jgi:hypothetical protein